VLGLNGQDGLLDTYVLTGDDREVLEQGIFGECHVRCLLDSRWGSLWASRWLGNFSAVRGWLVAAEADGLAVLRNPRLPEAVVIRDDGWMTLVGDHALARRDGDLVPVRHEINLPLHDHPEVARAISTDLAAGRSHPIMDLVDALRLGDRLLSRQALAAGALRPSDIAVARDDHVTATAEYSKWIPGEAMRLLLSARPT